VPTYQYSCTECGEQLEAVQSFSDPALTECPNCQGKLRKVFNSVGIVFKGSGFYRNDSRSGSVSSEKSGEKPAATSGDAPAKKADTSTSSAPPSSTSTSSSSSPSTSSGSTSSGGGSTKAAATT
jgi:putative FmdB family regulatory protein